MHLACCSTPPLCSVFWSEFGYHRYVCNSLLSDSVLFCVVLLSVLCNVLFCICVVLVRSAMSSYGMLRASPIWSFLFSVLVCVCVCVCVCRARGVAICVNNRHRHCFKRKHRISGLVVEYIVAIDVTRFRFPADVCM